MTNFTLRTVPTPLTVLAVAAILTMIAPAGQPLAAPLTPHRATYELSHAPDAGRRDARVLQGLMVYELGDDCDGMTLNDRTVIVIANEDGRQLTLESVYSAWEANDGMSFRFVSTFRLDGVEIEKIEGRAQLDSAGGAGEVRYTSPEEKAVVLPAGTRFPVSAGVHTLGLIEQGERQLSYILFDGSDDDGASFATDFVVDNASGLEGAPPEGDVELLESPSWRIRTAFFDLADETAPPTTELDGRTHRNGVISGFVLENDLFTARARLSRLEALPAGC